MAEYCKGIIYASKVRQNSLSELSMGDFKIDCFIIWVCVLFQLFYSVTVDSFWQFRINSFLGCALVPRRREEAPISSVHLTRLATPRWSVQSVYSVYSAGQCHMASCLSHQKTAQFDWYLLSEPGSARARHPGWSPVRGRGSHQVTSSTANQIRYSLAIQDIQPGIMEVFCHLLILTHYFIIISSHREIYLNFPSISQLKLQKPSLHIY